MHVTIYICMAQSRALCVVPEFLQMYACSSAVMDSLLQPFAYVELSMERIRNAYACRSSMCSLKSLHLPEMEVSSQQCRIAFYP